MEMHAATTRELPGPSGLVYGRPLLSYFNPAYVLSAVALVVIGLPKLHSGGGHSTLSLVKFPIMEIGIVLIGLGMTQVASGKSGVLELRSRFKWPTQRRWLLTVLVPRQLSSVF